MSAVEVDPFSLTDLTCPMPGCRWRLVLPAPELDPAREERRRAEIVRESQRHIASHPSSAWCRALTDAQAEIARLRGEQSNA